MSEENKPETKPTPEGADVIKKGKARPPKSPAKPAPTPEKKPDPAPAPAPTPTPTPTPEKESSLDATFKLFGWGN